jgi:hypothetical protein
MRTVTLDDMFSGGDVGYIDVLVTDTEGWDMQVGVGALGFLGEKRVGLYVFEIHENPLESVPLDFYIKLLNKLGYDCYWPLGSQELIGAALLNSSSPTSTSVWSATSLHRSAILRNVSAVFAFTFKVSLCKKLVDFCFLFYNEYRGWRNVMCANRLELAILNAILVSRVATTDLKVRAKGEPKVDGPFTNGHPLCGRNLRSRHPHIPFDFSL